MIAELKSVVTLYERDFLHLHKWHVVLSTLNRTDFIRSLIDTQSVFDNPGFREFELD